VSPEITIIKHLSSIIDEEQHLPVESSALGENYSLLIMGDSNVDRDSGGVDGDGSGGNSPSR
jgi:hypothetical protein